MSDLNPGKGLRIKVQEKTLQDLTGVLAELNDAYILWMRPGSRAHLIDILGEQYGWRRSEDEWGRKASWRVLLPNDNEVRISVIQKDAESDVVLDIREWWKGKK